MGRTAFVWLSCLIISAAVPHVQFSKRTRHAAAPEPVYGHVKFDDTTKKFSLIESKATSKEGVVAWGSSLPFLSTQGWDEVHIATNGDFENKQQAYAAGLLEGALTRERIIQFWSSWATRFGKKMRAKVNDFIKLQDAYLRSQSDPRGDDVTDADDVYWHHVGVVLAQFDGMLDGINNAQQTKMQASDLWIMNLDGDILDIQRALQSDNFSRDMTRQQLIELIELKGHCSALVKWTGDDLLIGHTTWSDFAELYRSYKHYKFAFRGASVKSQASSFSSYPGFVSSTDDYYLLDSGLAVIETTLNILNDDLYTHGVDPSSTVMAWVRNIVANRLAGTGEEWVDLFTRENSGTYNNQWMIVDFNRFVAGAEKLQPGTLWILEQIPGYVQAEDSTDLLQITTYWASYNRPYFKTINEKSMYQHYSDVHGEMFSYLECPRAKIFQREHKNVANMEDMRAIMQFNRYKEDELSAGCPGNAIASRFDLPPLRNSMCEIVLVSNGATDSKISNAAMVKEMTCTTRGGPTYDNVPRFSWQEWKKQMDSNYSSYYAMVEKESVVRHVQKQGQGQGQGQQGQLQQQQTTQQQQHQQQQQQQKTKTRMAALKREQEHYRQERMEYEEARVLVKAHVVADGGDDLRDALAEQQGYQQTSLLPEKARAEVLRLDREEAMAVELGKAQHVCTDDAECKKLGIPIGQPDIWAFPWFDMKPRMDDL